MEYEERPYEIIARYGDGRGMIRFDDGEEKEVKITKAGEVDRKSLRTRKVEAPYGARGKGRADIPMKADLMEKHNMVLAEVMSWGRLDLSDSEEVRRRLEWYFGACTECEMKPLVSEMALCLGIDRRRLWEMVNDVRGFPKLTQESQDIIKNFYHLIEIYFEANFIEGRIQPVVGIFYAKNNLGYKDQTETVITPNNPLSEVPDKEEVAQRYLEDMGHYGE